MRNRTVTLLLLLLACPLAGLAASKPQPLPPMTAETWRADLDFFAAAASSRRSHCSCSAVRKRLIQYRGRRL